MPATMLAQILLGAAAVGVANAQSVKEGVIATGTMGATNPPQPSLGTPVNQSSMARLISINAIDDFCLFAPPEPNSVIGDTETEEVAWCVQPRNNARVIPDGTLQAVHLVKTPLYWQIQGWGDFTKINIKDGDFGGELDPHGATGAGNPIGGNVTTNATGADVNYEEWMNYMSYQQFCLRICIDANSTYSAATMCQHTLDVMGCQWVMPGDYTNGTFTECEADPAYPPGVYPEPGGEYSTFAQRFTGSWGGAIHTIGNTVTPSRPAMTPASSNCKTYTSVGNGIPPAALSSDAAFNYTSGMTFTNLPTTTSAAPTATGTDGSVKAEGTPLTNSKGETTGTSAPEATATKGGNGANANVVPMAGVLVAALVGAFFL